MDEFELNLNNLLVDTFNSILRYEEMSLRAISKTPVTVTEAHILEVIAKQDQVTVSYIASALNIAVPTATVAVKKLESKGFVTKTPCADDGRRFMISLTETGEKINRAHELFHRRMVKNISSSFSDMEKDVLLSAVKKLNEFFRKRLSQEK